MAGIADLKTNDMIKEIVRCRYERSVDKYLRLIALRLFVHQIALSTPTYR